MAEPKEVHPLDELFRKSFHDLPAAPSTNGWDTPSAKVWEQVQENIKTPRSSWGQWAFVALGFAVLTVGLWFYFQNQPQPEPATQPQTIPQEQPVAQPQTDNTDAAVPASDAGHKATAPATVKSKKQPAPANMEPSTEAEPLPGTSKPLPGAKKVFPNNTERNKRQDVEDDTSDDRSLPKSGGNN